MFGLINYGDEFLGNNPFQISDLGFNPAPPGQGSGSLYVNPFRQGDRSAQDTLADLYEAEFQDYLNRFFPVEQDLINQMTTGFEQLQQEL